MHDAYLASDANTATGWLSKVLSQDNARAQAR